MKLRSTIGKGSNDHCTKSNLYNNKLIIRKASAKKTINEFELGKASFNPNSLVR